MAVKRKMPLRLLQEEALSRRLKKNHPLLPKILSSIEKRKAGFRGELAVDYHLSFLSGSKYTILNNIHLANEYTFQIDTLILSPSIFFIIESKNFSGTLFFDKHSGQFIQKNNGIETGFPNPIQQAKRQVCQLKTWLKKHKIEEVPIEYFVAISNPATIIHSNDRRIFQRLFHVDHLISKIYNREKYYKKPAINEKTIKKIKRKITQESASLFENILPYWNIDKSEILRGVRCPCCQYIPMYRIHSCWHCPSCKNNSKNAHEEAVKDFLLLMKETITNRECRDFLFLASRKTAAQILRGMNLKKGGTTKGAYYDGSHLFS